MSKLDLALDACTALAGRVDALATRRARKDADFKESDHPRAEDGKFGSGSGASKPSSSSSGLYNKKAHQSAVNKYDAAMRKRVYAEQAAKYGSTLGGGAPPSAAKIEKLRQQEKQALEEAHRQSALPKHKPGSPEAKAEAKQRFNEHGFYTDAPVKYGKKTGTVMAEGSDHILVKPAGGGAVEKWPRSKTEFNG